MQGKTHFVFGIFIGILLIRFLSLSSITKYLFFTILVIGSLIPDIDTPKSMAGRRAKGLSRTINFFSGHRGILHSLTIPIILLFIALSMHTHFLLKIMIYGITIGYTSHLFLDALTKQGIIILWPFKARVRGKITTNSFIDNFTFYILAIVSFLIILKNI